MCCVCVCVCVYEFMYAHVCVCVYVCVCCHEGDSSIKYTLTQAVCPPRTQNIGILFQDRLDGNGVQVRCGWVGGSLLVALPLPLTAFVAVCGCVGVFAAAVQLRS